MKIKSFFKFFSFVFVLMLATLCVACKPEPDPIIPDEPDPIIPEEPEFNFHDYYTALTVGEAVELAKEYGSVGIQNQVVIGYVKSVTNSKYGEMIIYDETGELYVYGSMSSDGTFYDQMTEKPVKGDQVLLTGLLMTYDGTPQMGGQGTKATIVNWHTPKLDIDLNDYTAQSIAEAREAEAGAKVRVDGVVASILYADGKIPSGFILVDETSSIHVHDNDIASQVKVGNNIEIIADKTFWILHSEVNNAELYGYKGACQLESVHLLSNDNATNSFDKSWITPNTVKGILETPASENITTLIYEVTAIVNKVEGTGFTNYYFNDLDGTTGSYTYTQCSGSDFEWLDSFDGKVCKVYLMALNAKSSTSGCIYRFYPVAVEEISDFEYDQSKVAKFAIDYAIADLIDEAYGANPQIKLPTTYSNSIISDNAVQFSYSSSNTSVATLTTNDDCVVLDLKSPGTSEITVTAQCNGVTETYKVTVELDPSLEIETPTIAEIIECEDDTLVQVRGIVVSSLVNREGFYLGDETGIIAVLADNTTMEKIKPGDEIVIEGHKVHHKKLSATDIAGQCAIVGNVEYYVDEDGENQVSYKNNTKLLANYYGENEYPTDYFITDKTLKDLVNNAAAEDYTNNVYVLDVNVEFVSTQFYSNIVISDPTDSTVTIRLYSSGAAQYSWLEQFSGQTIKVEMALCNWNNKTYYTGCIISVITENGKVINTLNWNH